MGRPIGDVAKALRDAADQQPDTVRKLMLRAGVGTRVGRYTASRMLERGELVVVLESRPAVVAAAGCAGVCMLPARSSLALPVVNRREAATEAA